MSRPLYLIVNIAGRKYDGWANHFNPCSPIYSRRERIEIVVSDMALCLVFAGLYSLANTYGWLWLVKVLPALKLPRASMLTHVTPCDFVL